MSSVGVPDILSGLRLARAQQNTKTQLATSQYEMVTGEAEDKVAATNGDPHRLYALETEIARIDSRLPLLEMAQSRAAGIQTAMENAQNALGDYAVELLGFTTIGDTGAAKTISRDAKAILGQVMAAFNVDVAGRHVFGGDEGDGSPLAGSDALLAHVRDIFEDDGLLVSYDPDGAKVQINHAVDGLRDLNRDEALAHYFGIAHGETSPPSVAIPPAAAAAGEIGTASARLFSVRDKQDGTTPETIYTGGVEDPPSVELSARERLDYAVTADDPAIRELVMNLAVIVVAGEQETGSDMLATLETAAEGLIAADNKITDRRSEVGLSESRIENAIVLNQSEKASFEQARAAMVGRDPYEAAMRVTELETQLQMIYAMTARTSRLSLLNYL